MKMDIKQIEKMIDDLKNGNFNPSDCFMPLVTELLENTSIDASYDSGEISIEMAGNPMGLSWLIAICIKSIIDVEKKKKRRTITIDEFLDWIETHYKILEILYGNANVFTSDNKEMADIISEMLKNPEKIDEVRKMMEEMREKK